MSALRKRVRSTSKQATKKKEPGKHENEIFTLCKLLAKDQDEMDKMVKWCDACPTTLLDSDDEDGQADEDEEMDENQRKRRKLALQAERRAKNRKKLNKHFTQARILYNIGTGKNSAPGKVKRAQEHLDEHFPERGDYADTFREKLESMAAVRVQVAQSERKVSMSGTEAVNKLWAEHKAKCKEQRDAAHAKLQAMMMMMPPATTTATATAAATAAATATTTAEPRAQKQRMQAASAYRYRLVEEARRRRAAEQADDELAAREQTSLNTRILALNAMEYAAMQRAMAEDQRKALEQQQEAASMAAAAEAASQELDGEEEHGSMRGLFFGDYDDDREETSESESEEEEEDDEQVGYSDETLRWEREVEEVLSEEEEEPFEHVSAKKRGKLPMTYA